MDNVVKDLMTEKEILLQSYEMYKNTRNEMLTRNSSFSLIKNIDKEMESVTEKIKSIDEKLAYYEGQEMAAQYIEAMKAKDEEEQSLYKMDEVLPIDFNPLRINHFIVRFPAEFKIKHYMIDGVWFANQSMMITIRESEGEYPILPIKLKDIANSEPFTMYIDILNSDGSIYYTIEYKNCSLETPNSPYLAYNDSNIRNWQVNITYISEEYLTALPNVYPDETAN